MLDKIDSKRLTADITDTLREKGIQFHKEKVFHNFLGLAQTPMGPVRLDTWVYSSFLVRPEEMDHLYAYHLRPSAMVIQRCLNRCARSRALLSLTSHEPITNVIGNVVGDYPIDHVQETKVNLTDTDVIDSVVEIGDQRFTVIEYDEGQIYLDPTPSNPIANGTEIRADFRNAHVDLSQGGVTVVTAPILIPRVLVNNGQVLGPEHLGTRMELFETDDFCGRTAVSWRASEVQGQEGHYHFTINFLCGFIVDPEKCRLVQ